MKKEIILVDDDPICLLVSKFLLEKCLVSDEKIIITSFKFPQDGLIYIENLMKRDNGKCSLKVLLDINMPKINGWEFLERLNTYDPEKQIRVIMHSSSIDSDDISMSLADSRVDCYVSKPLETTKALQVVDCFYNFQANNSAKITIKS